MVRLDAVIILPLSLLFSLLSLALAATPATFCKCTCFTNSTIIPLRDKTTALPGSCTTCNRAFCLEYNLPICAGANEKDVLTSCFQRDSTKDQVIVWGFMLGTAGLLGWAAVKKLLEARGLPALGSVGAVAMAAADVSDDSGGNGGARISSAFSRRASGGEREDARRAAYSPLRHSGRS